MKYLAAPCLAIAFISCLFVGATGAAEVPPCTESGTNATINGKVHTCGSCLGGSTNVWYVGDISADQATHACNCQHDKTYDCKKNSIKYGTPAKAMPAKERTAQ